MEFVVEFKHIFHENFWLKMIGRTQTFTFATDEMSVVAKKLGMWLLCKKGQHLSGRRNESSILMYAIAKKKKVEYQAISKKQNLQHVTRHQFTLRAGGSES